MKHTSNVIISFIIKKTALQSKGDVDCYNKDNNGTTYTGTVNTTSNNQNCLNCRIVSSPYVPYDENNAFCRNPNGFKKPWCYTGTGFQFGCCNIPVCDVDCYTTNNNGSSYVGTVHTSRLNHPCLNWQTVNSQLVSYHENHTFCRNPNGFGEPWCYTGTLNNGFENCDVSMCGSCESSPCHQASTCVKQVSGFKCTCAAGYTVALCSSTKHQLQVSPSITATSEVEVNYYADAKLVCNVTGYPTPRIKWKFTNKTLPSTSSTLILLRATNETAGIYTFIATNDVGASQADIKLKVTFDTPNIVSPLLKTVCKTGESYNFTCIATGHPSPEIS